MFQDTQPAALGAAGPDAWAPFRVERRAEVVALLRQLRDGSTPVVLGAPDGAAVVATLWSLDADGGRVHFTADINDPHWHALVSADEAVAVAYLDAVKLQFDLHDLMLVRGPQRCTLHAALPEVMYRFQRRAAYHVRTLDRQSPTARLRHPALPEMQLALRVVDVSLGGCALFLPDDVPPLEPGLLLHGVQLDIDTDTHFAASLRIQHVSSLNGQAQGVRLGCEWVALNPECQRVLQRCIDQTQKRRRLLSLD